jgi:hypothetical protein
MRNLAKIVVSIAACLVMADVAVAVNPAMPFVRVSLPRTPINVGGVWGPGLQEVTAEFDAHVVANCAFHVSASFREFKHEKGKAVMRSPDLQVAINGNKVPIGIGRVVIAESNRGTGASGVDVPLELWLGLRRLAAYPAGRYESALVITVTAGS